MNFQANRGATGDRLDRGRLGNNLTSCALVKSDPIFVVFLAIVLFELLQFKVARPDNLLKMLGELLQTRRVVYDIVLDTAHVFVCGSIVGASVDALTGVFAGKILSEIVVSP